MNALYESDELQAVVHIVGMDMVHDRGRYVIQSFGKIHLLHFLIESFIAPTDCVSGDIGTTDRRGDLRIVVVLLVAFIGYSHEIEGIDSESELNGILAAACGPQAAAAPPRPAGVPSQVAAPRGLPPPPAAEQGYVSPHNDAGADDHDDVRRANVPIPEALRLRAGSPLPIAATDQCGTATVNGSRPNLSRRLNPGIAAVAVQYRC
ncbi:hypothetical protein FOZ62_002162 [Perkinsus olseni]|uniref:Uncharacterized protein n=1 Tax=Perkinsus olseni TaxID=32597 RepID=A0A7J6SVK6_PEROL|nr:hypothetical protein FOZ62_002162 [Perkinsus olseni]